MMKAMPTQFDTGRLTNAVATPTCSSCCCCCCCLATSIASSSLLAQKINKEAKHNNIPRRRLLTLMAAGFMPVSGLLAYLMYWTIDSLTQNCRTVSSAYSYSYSYCDNPATGLIIPILIISILTTLWYLYFRVGIVHPLKRAILVGALIAIAFTAEFFAGAFAILTGVGGIVYLFMIPVIVGWLSVWYHKHLGKDTGPDIAQSITSDTMIKPENSPQESSNDSNSTPEQTPPPASTQQ